MMILASSAHSIFNQHCHNVNRANVGLNSLTNKATYFWPLKLQEEIILLHFWKDIIIGCNYPNKDNFVQKDSHVKSAIIIPLIAKDY